MRRLLFVILCATCFVWKTNGFQARSSRPAPPPTTVGIGRRSSTFIIVASKNNVDNNKAQHQQLPAPGGHSVVALFASTESSDSSSSSGVPLNNVVQFDTDAVVKYAIALVTQLGLFYGVFSILDQAVGALGIEQVPFAVNCVLFYGIALKSRVLNPLANNRPQVKTLEATTTTTTTTTTATAQPQLQLDRKRNMPSWTPPGIVFPIVWLLLIGPIRAVTSAMVYEHTLSYADPAIMALILHLSIGDIWNTINNVEKRYGVAVVGVLCVWLSKAFATYSYYQVDPLAGQLLAATLIWLTIAGTLVTATWRINPDPATGNPEPLYPVTGKAKTEFVWFSPKAEES